MGAPWDDSKLIRSLFWIVFFSYYKLQWTFLNQIMTCNEKLILYHNQWWPATGWTEKKPQSTSQSQTCTKKRSWSVFGGLLPIWSTTAFWIPMKQLHLKSMLSISMRHTENCNACRHHWSKEWAQFSTTIPNRMLHNQCFKSWMSWAAKFCLIRHIHLTSSQQALISSSILTTFFRENASTTSRRQKTLSNSSSNLKAWICTVQE